MAKTNFCRQKCQPWAEVRWFGIDRISHTHAFLESAPCQQLNGMYHVFWTGSDLLTGRALLPQAGRFWCQPICQRPGPPIPAAVSCLAGSWTFNPRPHLLFCHPRPHLEGGGLLPQFICSLFAIELCNKDKQNDQDVLNPTIPDFPILGQILDLPGHIKENMLLFCMINVFVNNFWTKKYREKNAGHHRIPLVETHRNVYILTPKGHFENLTSCLVNWPDLMIDSGRSFCRSVGVSWQNEHNDTSTRFYLYSVRSYVFFCIFDDILYVALDRPLQRSKIYFAARTPFSG